MDDIQLTQGILYNADFVATLIWVLRFVGVIAGIGLGGYYAMQFFCWAKPFFRVVGRGWASVVAAYRHPRQRLRRVVIRQRLPYRRAWRGMKHAVAMWYAKARPVMRGVGTWAGFALILLLLLFGIPFFAIWNYGIPPEVVSGFVGAGIVLGAFFAPVVGLYHWRRGLRRALLASAATFAGSAYASFALLAFLVIVSNG